MRAILKELNDAVGCVGSMVITPDGIMVAAALNGAMEEDAVAAFASSLLISLKNNLAKLRARSSLTVCTLKASDGCLLFVDMNNAYLVVVTRPDMQLDPRVEAIRTAVYRIQNRRIA
jgi:predicted regulator of Ras-like GTPase activity (Roadblock/LC7/MglB family)